VPATDNLLITPNRAYADEPFVTQSSFGKLSIRYEAMQLWNNLLLNAPLPNFNLNVSFCVFKSMIHEYLMQMQKYFFTPPIDHVICDFSCIESVVANLST
jgi:hypothetical protein